MPGLYSLRPGLGSASRTSSKAKAAVIENAVKAATAGSEQKKERDVVLQAATRIAEQPPPAAAYARRGWFELRAPQYVQQQPHAEPSKQQAVALRVGVDAAGKPRGKGVDILKRMSNTDYSSSGSSHEINSVCLAEMVHEFLEEETDFGPCGRARCNCKSGTCGDSSSQNADIEDSISPMVDEDQAENLRSLIACVSQFETSILDAVTATVRSLSDETEFVNGAKSSYRSVMSRLRAAGHNAALCKSRWEHTGGIPGGDYEYIDVLSETFGAKPERLIVDLDFKTQFEIARPSQQYEALLRGVPTIFVGKADRLLQILKILCEETKRSVKRKAMPLAPWRKAEYIKAKWFSMYKRTTNACSSTSSNSSRDGDVGGVIFRGLGWDPRFTTEMEADFNNRAAAEKRKVLRDTNGINHTKVVAPTVQASKKQEALEPEGVVRGAARLRHMLEMAKNSTSEAVAIGATTAGGEWEPPALDSSVRSGKAARKGTSMLAAIFNEGAARTRDEFREQPCNPVFATGAALI